MAKRPVQVKEPGGAFVFLGTACLTQHSQIGRKQVYEGRHSGLRRQTLAARLWFRGGGGYWSKVA